MLLQRKKAVVLEAILDTFLKSFFRKLELIDHQRLLNVQHGIHKLAHLTIEI